jgi:FixJ family two-component response regulator
MEAVVLEQERILLPFSISTGNATLASKMASLVSGAKEALEKAKKSLEIINALEVLLEASLRKEALDGSIHALDLELEILRSREKELSDEIHAREVSESQE